MTKKILFFSLLSNLIISNIGWSQNILVYSEREWYDGLSQHPNFSQFNITLKNRIEWLAIEPAEFASYDLIWLGYGGWEPSPNSLIETRWKWAPTITGRIIATGSTPTHHAGPPSVIRQGAVTFLKDAITWLLAGEGTALYTETDEGWYGMEFLSPFGLSACRVPDPYDPLATFPCFLTNSITPTYPLHPVMYNLSQSLLSTWGAAGMTDFNTPIPQSFAVIGQDVSTQKPIYVALNTASAQLGVAAPPPLVCDGICGDCDANTLGPDIIDALTAAQISAGLIIPTSRQNICCDVDSNQRIDVIDALLIAQNAAGLASSLTCPTY